MADGKTSLLRAYLVVGADELKRHAAVGRLRRYAEGDLADFNLDEVTASADLDPAQVVGSLQALPFGEGPRIVIIREADHLPKPVSEAIVAYLADPNPACVLCLEAAALAKGTRLYKAVAGQGNKAVIDCTPKRRKDLVRNLVETSQARYGHALRWDAADELVSRVGESTTLIDAHMRSLVQLVGDRPQITRRDVEEHVTRTAEVSTWDFVDAVSQRDAARALGLYAQMLKPSQIALLGALMMRLRELVCARSLAARGTGDQGSVAQALGKQGWQVKNHVEWSRRFADGELEQAFVDAAALERVLKGTGDDDAAFVTYVAKLCGAR